MVAQLAPDAVQLAGWLACLAFILGLVNGGLKLVDRVKGREPFPPNASLDARVAALERIEIESDSRRRAIYEKIEALRLENKSDAEGLHDRINDVLAAVSELRGEVRRKH